VSVPQKVLPRFAGCGNGQQARLGVKPFDAGRAQLTPRLDENVIVCFYIESLRRGF
jgi:hypothetical protein